MIIGKTKIELIMLSLGIFISVISQVEPLMEVMRPIMFSVWIFILVSFGIFNFHNIKLSNFSLSFIFIYVGYLIYCFLKSFYDPIYYDSNFIMVLLPPLLITVIGDFYKPAASYDDVQKLMVVFIISALLYAVYVQITYFTSLYDWMGNRVYAFSSKNSAAQIWGCATILIFTLLKFKNKLIQLGFYFIAGYLVLLCMLSQCRTAILGMSLACAWFMIKNKKYRILLLLAALIVLLIILLNWDSFSIYFNKVMFLGAEDDLDANKLSSGRIGYYEDAIQQFSTNPLLGVGPYYVDDHYLCVLTDSGILGTILIESIWLKRIFLNFKYEGKANISLFLTSITLFYCVESLFEAYPPFGPGVCALVFWLSSQLLRKY